MEEKIITAIDLGSSKICVIIAGIEKNKLEIKGVGISESRGIDNGLVKDLQKAAESLSKAVKIAETQANIKAENVFVAISGEHIKCRNAEGRVSCANGNQPSEIEQWQIDLVINDAKKFYQKRAGY